MSAVLAPTMLPRITREAIGRAAALGLESLRALPPMKLSEWAAQHFVLAGESSHQRGAWEAWPFQIGILDMMSDDDIEELDVFKAKRIGYTKMLTASIGFDAAWRRRNQAVWQPTDDDRDSFVKTEVDPMLDGVPVVRAARRVTKGVEDTIKYKPFRDSVLHLLGGKAARAYRRITVAAAKLDEIDGFDRQIEKSADAVTLAHGRLEGAPFPKLIVGSTPRIKGISNIEDRAELATAVMRFHITCIHCGVEHPLRFGSKKVAHGFKWDRGDPDSVRHVCPHCRNSITQSEYLRNWTGAWVCEKTGLRYGMDQVWRTADGTPTKAPRHVCVKPWTAYSPQRDWPDIVRQFLAAKDKLRVGERGPMQGFVNEVLGETWEEEIDRADEHELAKRPHTYKIGQVPTGALVLVAGVDMQDNRFEIVVWGIGRGEEMWVIDYQVLAANPALEADWEKLDAYLLTRFAQQKHGGKLGIEAVAIDTGGHFTHNVYNFVRTRPARRRIAAVKGSSTDGRPIKGKASRQDVNWRGQIIKRGVQLWEVGTDTAKDTLFGRLKVDGDGPGAMHFPEGLPGEFYRQLTSEGRVLQRIATGEKWRWVKPSTSTRNEVLDCSVYALFAAHLLDLHRYTDAMWDRLEAAVQPPPDLFSAPADDEPKAAEPEPIPMIIPRAALARQPTAQRREW